MSHYVCIVRNPADVLNSNKQMFSPQDMAVYADSYMASLQLTLEIADTFPNVFVLFHERITQETFDTLGEALGVSLRDGFAAYDKKFQKTGRWGRKNADLPLIDLLVESHRRVSSIFSPKTLRRIPDTHWQSLARHLRIEWQEARVKGP